MSRSPKTILKSQAQSKERIAKISGSEKSMILSCFAGFEGPFSFTFGHILDKVGPQCGAGKQLKRAILMSSRVCNSLSKLKGFAEAEHPGIGEEEESEGAAEGEKVEELLEGRSRKLSHEIKADGGCHSTGKKGAEGDLCKGEEGGFVEKGADFFREF